MEALSLVPDQQWKGDVGPFSTFGLQIGDPPQHISVLAATSKHNIWAVDAGQCERLPSAIDCELFFGGVFDFGNSQSFERIQDADQFFDLPFDSELILGYNGTAVYGTDSVTVGGTDGGDITLPKQAVAAFGTTNPFLAAGFFGLADTPLNVTGLNDSHPSPLGTLREQRKIPSTFWAYNAGAWYRNEYASLTLGGYDSGRGGMLDDAMSVPMQDYQFRDLVVSIRSFAIGDSSEYAYAIDPVEAFIDSVVPEIWLPYDICRVFEQAFDLEWDDSSGMYLLDDDQFGRLKENLNDRVVFGLTTPDDPGRAINISLPFAAFASNARYPLAGIQDDSSRGFFALKPTNDSDQIYLGHTFLQEAYLAVDYDSNVFYLSQAKLGDDAPASSLQTVIGPKLPAKGLSTGAIAGIAVGVVIVALLAAGLAVWYCCRPRWRKRRNSRFRARMEAENIGLPDSQLPPSQETEMTEFYAKKRPLSPDSDTTKQELDATTTARGSITERAEMESPSHSSMNSPRGKMSLRRTSYGFPSSPAELESRSPRMMHPHSRTASDGSIPPMSPLSATGRRTELERTEELHELP